MIRLLWLRWLAGALETQRRGLIQEKAGVDWMIQKNDEDRRRVAAQLAMLEVERRYRVVR